MKKILTTFAIAAVGALSSVFALTPAGTAISNQATANFVDSGGQPQRVSSNQVISIVQQVYGFTITPNGTTVAPGQNKEALPGAPVYFAYQVQNSGNGADFVNFTQILNQTGDNFDFASATVYEDANCSGTVDSGEAVVTSIQLTQVGTTTSNKCVVVAVTIPSSATNAQTGLFNLIGTSAGSPSTTDNNNWAQATATTAAALDISKSASPNATATAGGNIVYTITGQNRGGSAAAGVATSVNGASVTGVLVADILPNGLTVSAAPSGTAGAGTIQIVKSTDAGLTWSTTWSASTGDAAGNVRVGMFVQGASTFFPQGASYTLSVTATVPSNALQGTSYVNRSQVSYQNNGSNVTINSNNVTNTVSASYNVLVGQNQLVTTPATYTSAGGNTVNRSVADTQTIASVYNGKSVYFYNTLQNTGNSSDSFMLAVSGAPATWVCSILQNDHSTSISTAVGPFTAGATFDFDVVCAVPATYTSSTPVSLTVTTTSVGDSTKTDTSTDVVSAVVSGYSVDEAAHGNTGGASTDDNPAAQSANPSQTVNFAFDVKNSGANADNFNLIGSVPAGWNAIFYPDANCDGVMDAPAPSSVSGTGILSSGNVKCFIATVQVASSAAPGSNTVTFTAQSTTDAGLAAGVQPASTDTITTSVVVNLVSGFTFDPDHNDNITSPGTQTYSHNLVNTGNAPATASIAAVTSNYAGWTYQYSTDNSTWSSSLSGITLGANGGSQVIYVRLIVPGSEPIGRTESITITATASYGATSVNGTVTDTTTVVGGEMKLDKTQRNVTQAGVAQKTNINAKPGDEIEYLVTATNIGTGSLTAVKISDPLPSYTNFVSVNATASVAGTILYSVDGIAWSSTAPVSGVVAGTELYVGLDTNADGNITTADNMVAGASVTITLRVSVQ